MKCTTLNEINSMLIQNANKTNKIAHAFRHLYPTWTIYSDKHTHCHFPSKPALPWLPRWFSSSSCSEREALGINGTVLQARCSCCHPTSSEGNSKHWPQPKQITCWIYPFLIYQLTTEGRGHQTLVTPPLPMPVSLMYTQHTRRAAQHCQQNYRRSWQPCPRWTSDASVNREHLDTHKDKSWWQPSLMLTIVSSVRFYITQFKNELQQQLTFQAI